MEVKLLQMVVEGLNKNMDSSRHKWKWY